MLKRKRFNATGWTSQTRAAKPAFQETTSSDPTPESREPSQEFVKLGLSRALGSRLAAMAIQTPTAIQSAAIPVILDGSDVIGIAQTGTGKTLAFGLPIVQLLERDQQALVLAPTRELAVQIDETFRKLGVQTALLIGGAAMSPQVRAVKSCPKVIVATPGRLKDHLSQRTLHLKKVAFVVLDEADRMLDMGFIGAIREILAATNSDRQTLLFSATFPNAVKKLASELTRQPERVEVHPEGTPSSLVTHELIVLPKEDKKEALERILRQEKGSVLVFSRTRHGARKIAKSIRTSGHTAAELHSDRTLAQRMSAMQSFKSGDSRILVATDIAARGIDVKGISLVLNYDIPECAEDYVHRIGRTGRAGAVGRALTFASPEQHGDVRDIEKLVGRPLDIHPDSQAELPKAKTPQAKVGLASPKQGMGQTGSRTKPRRSWGRRP